MEKVLEASGLALGYKLGRKGTKVVHKGLNLALHAGESVALLGANGSGKSTLIKTLCGFIPSLAGTVLLLGKPLAQYSKRELSRLIGVVLTERVADGGLTVWDLVSLGRYPYTGFFGVLQKEDTIAVERAMDIIGIRDMAGRYISQLSDGERQKAMIAKCLAQECPVIILDEPTAFLDVRSRIEITDILPRLAMEEGKSILMSTHDFELALQLSDTLWIFPKDREFVSGTPEDLIFSGEMDAVFGAGTNVLFDRNTGAFRAKSGGGTDILTEGSGTELFWLKNALRRNGFCPVEESPRPFGKVVIESGIITFHRREYTIKVASFGALLDLLRELRKETVETERR